MKRRVPRLMLAPMAGFTDAAMRRLCHAFGAERTFTEMAHSMALVREAARFPGAGGATWELLETLPDEGPVAAHLFGSDPATLGEAAGLAAATGRFCAIDLNAGCPVRKVVSTGAGAALVHDPAKIGAMVAAMRSAAGAVPVTVKTRLGPSPDRVAIFEILDAVEQAGASSLAVHGRFASQGHGGPVDLGLLAEVKRRARIPVAGNGGLLTAADAVLMAEETGVDALLVGRGAMGNPWIFAGMRSALEGEAGGIGASAEAGAARDGRRVPQVPPAEIRRVLEAHIQGELELRRQIAARRAGRRRRGYSPEQCTVAAFRRHFFRYFAGVPGASALRGRLNGLRTLDDVKKMVDAAFPGGA
ncbi:MAG: tRNA dihydrouridine synthase [Kiritimatiellia bacterium]